MVSSRYILARHSRYWCAKHDEVKTWAEAFVPVLMVQRQTDLFISVGDDTMYAVAGEDEPHQDHHDIPCAKCGSTGTSVTPNATCTP